MDGEKTLHLRAMAHLAFSLLGVLVGHLGPVILVLSGSMSSR